MKNNVVRRSRASRRDGFTLTEITIVLGIFGVVAGSIWIAMSSVVSHNQLNRASDELEQIVTNVHAFYSGQNVTYSALSASNPINSVPLAVPSVPGQDFCLYTPLMLAANMKVFPNEMLNGGLAYNPWSQAKVDCGGAGGSAEVSLAGQANPVRFGVRYVIPPPASSASLCEQLLVRNSLAGTETNLVRITVTWVGSTTISTNYNSGTTCTAGGLCPLPLAVTDAYIGCTAGTGTLYVDWYYRVGG